MHAFSRESGHELLQQK